MDVLRRLLHKCNKYLFIGNNEMIQNTHFDLNQNLFQLKPVLRVGVIESQA